jgi:hypothetical protein
MSLRTLFGSRAEPRASFWFCSRAEPRASTLLTTCLALGLVGCSFHAHSEFRTGSGGEASSGAEQQSAPEKRTEREARDSPRDNVVRVTPGASKPAVEQGAAAEPPRTVVRPTGDVPPSSSDAQGSTGAGAASAASAGSASGAGGEASPASTPTAPSEPEPAAAQPSDTPRTTKGNTRKSPSEPHVAVPAQNTQKPRKVNRASSDAGTKKDNNRN